MEGGWVAPCAGAWIEASIMANQATQSVVAPCAGAWIEALPNKLVA